MKRSLMKTLLIPLAFSVATSAQELDSDTFRKMVSVEAIQGHQKKLQEVARQNGGNRQAGYSGYDQSANYVYDQMIKAGYNVKKQDFTIKITSNKSTPELKKLEPKETSFVFGTDFLSVTNEGQAEITGKIEAVDLVIPSLSPNQSSSGCEEKDFANFTPGNIALIQRGTCAFNVKVANAKKAHALGVILFNEGNPERTEAFSAQIEADKDFAVLTTSFWVGDDLRSGVLNGPTDNYARIKVDVEIEARNVQNVIAETKTGNTERVITIGAHLDSVKNGPGINDNGSGSATILEIAKQYAELKTDPKNQLRFIWFSAEELGLLGSEFYVKSLSAEEKNKILSMLNFDMLSSPNYARFVYDGDNSGQTDIFAQKGPTGSEYLEKIFLDYFRSQNMASSPTGFSGRSDYGPFIKVGIPAGGLFSGAEGIKSRRMASLYGGIVGEPYDHCYHRACDNMETNSGNLATKSLDELSDAAAHAVFLLAQTSDNIRTTVQGDDVPEVDFIYQGDLLIK